MIVNLKEEFTTEILVWNSWIKLWKIREIIRRKKSGTLIKTKSDSAVSLIPQSLNRENKSINFPFYFRLWHSQKKNKLCGYELD